MSQCYVGARGLEYSTEIAVKRWNTLAVLPVNLEVCVFQVYNIEVPAINRLLEKINLNLYRSHQKFYRLT
jgi:hypothetical protein